ncbi:MAG: hypothetical protein ACYTHK_05300 [Planctomycetota bacterium]
MRIPAAGLLLLAACGTGPRADFDSGVTVHFVMIRERPPEENVTLNPVFTVGDAVVRGPAITFGPDEALAQEAAVVRVTREKKARISFWDPVTRTGARETADARHELWVVVDLADLGGEAELEIYRKPPNQDLQEWIPLAEISD